MKKHKISKLNFYIGLLILCSISLSAQDTNQNFVKQITYKLPSTTRFPNPTMDQAQVNVTYLDGLTRPIVQIAGKQAGNDKDLVNYVEYDQFGRQAKQYLPYVAATDNLQFVNYNQAMSGLQQQAEYTGQQAFSEKEYDFSPLNRTVKQSAPGTTESWAMGSGHEIKYEYTASTLADKVKKLSVVAGAIVNNGFMTELYKNTVVDEDGNKTETYTDIRGRLVLKRNFLAGLRGQVTLVDTYYLYDFLNNLAFVIPPAAATLTGTAPLENLCYQYKYDDKKRLTDKKEPGKEWEYIVYDKLNRIVAVGPTYSPFGSKDDVKGWLFSFYDQLNRVCYTGWQQHAFTGTSRQGLQSTYEGLVNNVTKSPAVNNLDGLNIRYSTASVPSGLKLLSVNYYDNYDFPGFAPTAFPSNVYYNLTRKPMGLATGSWSRALATGTIKGEYSYVLYDYRSQPVVTAKKNHLDKTTQVSSILDFTGKPQTVTTVQQPLTGTTNLTTVEAFTYTSQGRLLRHTHKSSNKAVELLAYNKYNNLGQVITKMVGDINLSGNAALQKIDYSYNIRGWLKGINNVNETNPVAQQGAFNDLFAFGINYNDNPVDLNEATYDAKKLYNGNISETLWRSASDNQLRKYGFSYDRLGRLLDAVYQKPEADTPWRGSYDERTRYDINGNITSVQRHGNLDTQSQPVEIDNLQYYYDASSNKLRKVHDSSNSTLGFKDNTGSVGQPPAGATDFDYDYDFKGNQTYDKNKGISAITYNHLNLPVEITFNSNANTKITYLYTADGTKVQKLVKTNATAGVTTNYISGFQYKGTTLEFFPVSGGYVKSTVVGGVDNYNYVFHYLDHLGNIRLSYAKDIDLGVKILEENHYYPYGLKHTNYNSQLNAFKANEMDTAVVLRAEQPQASYPYKFSAMEWQDELGLNLYDMELRDYDPAIGRWTGIDPVTHHSQSTYNAFDGNPVSIADPSGGDGFSAGAGGENFTSVFGMVISTPTNTGMYTGYAPNASFGSLYQRALGSNFGNRAIYASSLGDIASLMSAYGKVKAYHEPSVTYDGEHNTTDGGRLDTVNLGFWETISIDALKFTDTHLNGGLATTGMAVHGYSKLSNDIKRSYAYKLSKITNMRSGEIFQGANKLFQQTGKITQKLGPVGTALSVGTIAYETGTNTWDAHTIVNGALIIGGGVAAAFGAPAVLTGIAVYGIADYFFDISGSIDNAVGRNSSIWKP